MGRNRGVVVVALMLLFSSCSSGEPEATAPTTAPVTVEPTTTTTAAPTKTTTELETTTTPNTAEPTTTTIESPFSEDEQAVIRSGHIFWDLVVRANTPAASVDDPDYFRFITGPALVLMLEVTERQLANGEDVRGPVYLQPTTVSISGSSARLVECVLDAVDTLDSDGEIIEPADLAPTVWQTDFEWSGEEWRTTRFTRLDGTCVLDRESATVIPLPLEVYDELTVD